jgi:thiopurine S-methyltransferase
MNDYWNTCWETAHTPWSYEGSDDLGIKLLPQYLLKLSTSKLSSSTPLRALVPLCGNSSVVRFLHEYGCDVTGVDLVTTPLRDLRENAFSELSFEKDRGPSHTIWSAERLTLIEGDFFDVSLEHSFDIIYDRAALVAIAPEQREQYASKLLSLLASGGLLFLEFFDVGTFTTEQPPFPVDGKIVRTLFGSLTEIYFSAHPKKTAESPFQGSSEEEFLRCWAIFQKE